MKLIQNPSLKINRPAGPLFVGLSGRVCRSALAGGNCRASTLDLAMAGRLFVLERFRAEDGR